MLTTDRQLGRIPTIRDTPYYLGAAMPMQPAGSVVNGGDTGIPDPAGGAEQDPGAVDVLAEINKTWFEINSAKIITGTALAITAALIVWAVTKKD